MAKQSNYNPDGNLVVRGNIVGDENIYITGNAVITGTLSVTGEATYSSDTVTQNAADGYVINSDNDNVPAYLQLNNSTTNVRLTYGTDGILVVSKPTEFSENVTLAASKTLNAPTITDGTASITGGTGTGFTNITSTLFTGILDGTATTAGNLQSDRTLSLTGPITGSIPLGLNANTSAPSIATTITNSSVTLGTHTAGQYASTLTGGTGIVATTPNADDSTPYTITLDDTAVTPGSYGTAAGTGSFTVDQQGRLTAATTTAIQIVSSQLTDFDTEVRGNISVTDSGGDGSLSYNNSTGVITYTGPSAAEVRAHFSASTGLTYNAGVYNITNSGVTAASYGSVTAIPTFTVNAQGQLTAAADVNIAIPASQVTDFSEAVDDRVNALIVDGDGITKTYNDGSNTYTLDVDSTVARSTGDTFTGDVFIQNQSSILPTSSGGNYVPGTGNNELVASTRYVEAAISSLIDGAPGTLNTLNEIAEAINDDDNAYTTLTNNIATKVSKAGDSMSGALAMGSNKITGLADPTDPQDAATQAFVGTANANMLAFVNSRDDTKVDKTETIASTSFYFAPTSSAFGTDTSIDYSATGGIKFTPILSGTASAILVQGNQTPDYTQKRHGQLTITGDLTIQPGIENNTSAPTDQRGTGSLNVHGNTTFTSENKGVDINATAMVAGKAYQITETGTTDFTNHGAADSNVGTIFTATSVGTGSGKVQQPIKSVSSNMNHGFFKHTIGLGESALYILGGNIFYQTKANEIDTYIVSETSGAGTIGQHASDTSNTTLQAKSLGVDRAHFQTFGNSTMFIGNIAHISSYTNVSYGGSTYTTGTRPLERLTVDGGVIMGPRTGDDELLVNGTIFFDDGVFKVIEGGIIKQVTTSSTSDLFFTSTATGRVEVGKDVGGDYYFPALGPDAVNSIQISTAGNVSANVTTLSANLDLVRDTARGNISTTGANLSYDSATGVITSTVGSLTTSDVAEGSNKYYTDERVDDRVNSLIIGGANVTTTYDDAAGTLTIDADLAGDMTSVVAGAGLTGGGTSGDVTLNVVGGTGISVNANDIELTASGVSAGTYGTTTAIPTVTVNAQGQLTNASETTISYDNFGSWSFTTDSVGNEAVSSAELVTFVGGTNMDVTHSGNTITISTNADVTGIIAGSGMTGGGTSGDVTVNVIGGDGITANANDIAVDSTVVRTSGNQTIAGNKTLTGNTQLDALNIAGNYDLPTADGSANEVLTTDGAGNLTFADVTTIGGTITGVTAGDGLTGGGVSGTVTLNVVGGTGISAGANEIAIDFTEFNTGSITEGTNLYYTNARADARITAALIDEDNMASDSATRLPSQQSVKAYVDSQVASKDALSELSGDTDDVTEGTTNLYHTTARARAAISENSTQLAYDSGTGVMTFTQGNTDTVAEGSTNLYYTNARADARITNALLDEDNMASNSATKIPSQQSVKAYVDAQVATKDALSELSGNTDDVSEGSTNLYYTDARAQAVSINNVVEDTTPQLGGNLDTNGNDILVADNDKVIFGAGSDLQIYHDTNDSYISDQGDGSIFILSGTTYLKNSAGTKTSIATNSGAGQSIYYNNQVTLETIDGGAKVTGNLEVTGNFLTATTDNLDEGSSNQYYTVARANSAIDARVTNSFVDALNVDADTVDSLHASSFLRSDAADSHTHTITPSTDNSIDLGSTSLRYNEVHGVTFKGTATQAEYADLAENYVADSEYPVGTVVVLGGDEEVTVTDTPNSPRVAGVVSTDPAYLMNAGQSGHYVVAVALRGRVPVRVEGVVKKGDVLVTSGTPGVAMVGSDPHFIGAACIIGKAISSKDHVAEGIVEVLI